MAGLQNLTQLFLDAVDRYGTKRAAQRYKSGGIWHNVNHQQLARKIKLASVGLRDLGLKPGDRVAILSETRAEWAIADYACLMARCVDVSVYPTLPPDQISYILRDSGARAIFVSNAEQREKVSKIRHEVSELRWVLTFEDVVGSDDETTLPGLIQRGASVEEKHVGHVDDALGAKPNDLAAIIYTSGTTGDPKGVMLTHGNFCSNVLAVSQILRCGPEDSCLSFLPLAHSLERMGGHYYMFHNGVTINYAEDMDSLAADMLEVRPTVMLAVPRVFEKIYARVLENALEGGSLKRRFFFWAKRNAEQWAGLELEGEAIPRPLALKKAIADKLVFAKLRKRTGGRIRFFVSGGAPLSAEIARFFYAAGLTIAEGYGLTETSPVVSLNSIEDVRIGSVGRPLSDVDVRIAEDGEVLCRGPNVMQGYYNQPDATDSAIDGDGWFHTGDIGEIDPDGYISITDRKKDIIVTAGGKNIAPQPIENKIKLNKYVLNAVMLGDKQRFPIILVVPHIGALQAWANERKMNDLDTTEMLAHPDIIAKVEREVMLQLRGLASYETPKKTLLIEKDFTIDDGALTPTMKVKRRVIEQRYADLIRRAYS